MFKGAGTFAGTKLKEPFLVLAEVALQERRARPNELWDGRSEHKFAILTMPRDRQRYSIEEGVL